MFTNTQVLIAAARLLLTAGQKLTATARSKAAGSAGRRALTTDGTMPIAVGRLMLPAELLLAAMINIYYENCT